MSEYSITESKIVKIHQRLQEYYNVVSEKYETVSVMLYGSQNYKLDTPTSDIDAKAIVLPSFEDIVLNRKPVSTTIDFGKDKGIVDVKDIRLMFGCFKKQNINFVELLFTPYVVVNKEYLDLFERLRKDKENIARYDERAAINCMVGMAHEKFVALKHPYPTIKHKIDMFGYDPKQLHHMLRLDEFTGRYMSGEKYADCLITKMPDYLKEIKSGVLTLQEAEVLAEKTINKLDTMKKDYFNNVGTRPQDVGVSELMDKITYAMLKCYFKRTTFGDENG
jgi:predicted nucleotidyltransferase